MNAVEQPRPQPKTQLPFRVHPNVFHGLSELEFTHTITKPMSTERLALPFRIREGVDRVFEPLMELIRMYRDLEAQQDALVKERDDALAELAVAQPEKKHIKDRMLKADEVDKRRRKEG